MLSKTSVRSVTRSCEIDAKERARGWRTERQVGSPFSLAFCVFKRIGAQLRVGLPRRLNFLFPPRCSKARPVGGA